MKRRNAEMQSFVISKNVLRKSPLRQIIIKHKSFYILCKDTHTHTHTIEQYITTTCMYIDMPAYVL